MSSRRRVRFVPCGAAFTRRARFYVGLALVIVLLSIVATVACGGSMPGAQ
jgi:hypothetical protein